MMWETHQDFLGYDITSMEEWGQRDITAETPAKTTRHIVLVDALVLEYLCLCPQGATEAMGLCCRVLYSEMGDER